MQRMQSTKMMQSTEDVEDAKQEDDAEHLDDTEAEENANDAEDAEDAELETVFIRKRRNRYAPKTPIAHMYSKQFIINW